jgi:dephospho-CoA kinase
MTQVALTMFVVGVTGGIGSGKSAATHRFADLGIDIVDADLASRAVVEPGTPALQQITEHFGDTILIPGGALDRAALRKRIFDNEQEKQWLETLLHPLIGKEIRRELESATSRYVIFVSPLLIEAQQDIYCDHVLVIDVPEELQVQRTVSRDNNDEAQVRRIINSQATRQQRLDKADDVIENIGELPELERQIDQLHQKYLVMALEQTVE